MTSQKYVNMVKWIEMMAHESESKSMKIKQKPAVSHEWNGRLFASKCIDPEKRKQICHILCLIEHSIEQLKLNDMRVWLIELDDKKTLFMKLIHS